MADRVKAILSRASSRLFSKWNFSVKDSSREMYCSISCIVFMLYQMNAPTERRANPTAPIESRRLASNSSLASTEEGLPFGMWLMMASRTMGIFSGTKPVSWRMASALSAELLG